MAAIEVSAPPLAAGSTRPAEVEQRRLIPVKWWAGIGAAFVALVAYIMIAWVASGQATPTKPGPTPVPSWMHVTGIAMEIFSPIMALLLTWRFLVRPWIRDRRIPFDGLFLLGFASIYWQDPIINYTQAWASYNASLFNLGSWSSQIPGWQSPNGHLFPEPFLFSGFGYMWSLFLGALAACWAMRKVKERWPRTGRFGLIMFCWAFISVIDLIMEVAFMRLSFYNYGGSIPSLTLFHGRLYQFPVYEAVMWGGLWAVWACFRYFRNDRGETVAELGIDKLRVGVRAKTGLRLLAIVGFMNLSTLLLYMVPWQIVATHSGPWIRAAQTRSYMTAGLCGPGTEFACSGPKVPIATQGSAHVDPAGG